MRLINVHIKLPYLVAAVHCITYPYGYILCIILYGSSIGYMQLEYIPQRSAKKSPN